LVALTEDRCAMLPASATMLTAATVITVMMLITTGIGALILPLRTSLFLAATTTLALPGLSLLVDGSGHLLGASLLGLAYFATTGLCHLLGRQIRTTQALATQRGLAVANLSQLIELSSRR